MDEIINKYKDENGYIKELGKLFLELKESFKLNEINHVLDEIIINNSDIIKNIRKNNKENKKYDSQNIKKFSENNYIKENVLLEESNVKKVNNKKVDYIDINYLVLMISNLLENDLFIDVLPPLDTSNNILIVCNLLAYYLKKIMELEYLIVDAYDSDLTELLEELDINKHIYKVILDYKQNYKICDENSESIEKSNLVFYCDSFGQPYFIKDIVDSPEAFNSMKILVNQMITRDFKDIKGFTHVKGLFELRDTSYLNNNRIFFTFLGDGKLCIVGALTNKKDVNTIYMSRIVNRYKSFNNNQSCIKNDDDEIIKKILKGDFNA